MKLEPFTFEVIQDSFYAITEEMGAELVRIANSTIIRESRDCATGLTDAFGQVVAQAALTPGHFMTIASATKGALRAIPAEQWKPGDVVITNDPWICAGHLPDTFLLAPFFHSGRLIGFLSCVAHQIDIGGVNPGGTTPNTSSIYDEGLQLPPVKIFNEGKLDRAVLDIIQKNSRMPDVVGTDFQAEAAVTIRGQRLMGELCDKYGADAVTWAMQESIDRSESQIRQVFASMADGVYEAEDFVDDDYWTDERVRIKVTLTVKGSDLYVDYTGSGAQTRGGINVTPPYRDAYTQMAIRCFTGPSIPQNEGCYKPVHISAPLGTVLNPRYPAAVAGRHTCIPRITDVVAAVMSQTMKGRALAGSGGLLGQPVFSGFDGASGRRWIMMDNSHGGLGARADQDGVDCVAWPWNASNHPIESLELQAPLRIARYQLHEDSEGPGTWRGGLGLIKDYELLADGVNVQTGGDRFKAPSTGLAGGGVSIPQEYVIIREGETLPVKSKSELTLRRGDVFSVRMPGGGGFGPAWRRDLALVVRDVSQGYVSPARARSAYGVALRADGTIDEDETAALRSAMKGAAGG